MDPLRNRIQRYVARLIRWAMVVDPGEDDNPYPTQRVEFLGKQGDSQTWFPYGFTALAPRDALSLMWAIGGDGASRVHMPGSPLERPKMKEGEVAMYHPASGAIVHMLADGTIEIESALEVKVIAPLISLTGTTNIVGPTTVTGGGATVNLLSILGNLNHDGSGVGFYGIPPISRPSVTGTNQGGSALTSLLSQLEALGLITDDT